MKKLLTAAGLAALLAAGVAMAAGTTTIKTAHTTLGRVLVSSNGRTLYLLEGDSPKHLTCTGSCLAYWPPLMKTGRVTVAGGARGGLVGTVRRGRGRQITYDGHPLYRFARDTRAGQTTGEDVLDPNGHRWYAVSAAGSAVERSSSARRY